MEIDYYAQLPKFDNADNISVVRFININSPGSGLGAKRTHALKGLLIVAVLAGTRMPVGWV